MAGTASCFSDSEFAQALEFAEKGHVHDGWEHVSDTVEGVVHRRLKDADVLYEYKVYPA